MRPKLFLALIVSMVGCPALAADKMPRYLSGPGVDLVQFLPNPPAKGSLLEKRDLDVFEHHRPAVGSARWRSATADVDETVAAILRDFSSAAGTTLMPEMHPILTRLLVTMRRDVIAAIDAAKGHYARPRPFQMVAGPVCQPKADLAKSFDYPSGHTMYGTSVALVLAEIRPDHANAILARGHEFGDSRFICGAHSVSAVDAGRQAAAAIVAVLHGSEDFRADLESARKEMSAGRGS